MFNYSFVQLIKIIIKFNQSLNVVQTSNIKENFEINNITVKSPKLASTINFINIDDGCNILKSSKYFKHPFGQLSAGFTISFP